MAISSPAEAARRGPALLAGDEFDELLRSRVHPADWRNPVPRDRYHLVVLGGGTAGLVTAAIAAGLGARVALVERDLLGGDCLNVGCVPSKALIESARADGTGDFALVMQRLRRIRAELSRVDSAERFTGLGVDVFLGEGRFVAADTLEVAGATLRFRRAVIATGARATVPPVPGLADAPFLTNETVFTLTELPRRLAVLGAGPIGCELAQAFARLGSEVHVIDQAARILPGDDPDAAEVVRRSLERDGVRFHLQSAAAAVARAGAGIRVTLTGDAATPITADRLLVAVGRTPNVDGIGLDVAGVRTARHGIEVDDRLRTSNPRIFAIGDAASPRRFTHHADAQARIVVPNALFFGLGGGRASRLVVPWCTYTEPELAHTGRTAAELDEEGARYDTITVPFEEVDRAALDGAREGFVRVHLARGSDRILGATIVGRHAGELISEVTLAIRTAQGLGAVGATIHPYPTRAEGLRKAADAWRRGRLTPRARKLFAGFFALFR